MRWQFVIFFSIFFTIYGLVNFYILRRSWQALELHPQWRLCFVVWFIGSALVYFIGRWLENYYFNPATDALVWYGAFWLGLIVYAFFAVLFIDLIRSVLLIVNPTIFNLTHNYAHLKFTLGVGVSALILIVLSLGFLNASEPKVKNLSFNVDKTVTGKKDWNIVMVSDIHLGSIINKKRAMELVDSINKLTPDLVLLVGDTIDEDIGAVKRQDIGEALKNIKSVNGVYAVTGNHEYIGGVEEAVKYLEEHNIKMLQDQTSEVDNLILVGRKDKMSDSMKNTKRLGLGELLSKVDTSKPIILMDHEPFKLQEMADDGRVDVQLSGHTHHGQLWPFNFITKAMYEISWGYNKINKTNFYVSSGWGTWGPPIRVGNTPELVNIQLHLK